MKTISQLDKLLWKHFSKYIKERDDNICFTCDKEVSGRSSHAGHFISRRYKKLKYDDRNVHCQCYRCNMYMSGNYPVYRARMIERYGEDLVKEFEAIAVKGEPHRLTKDWYEDKIKHYRKLNKEEK